LFVDNIGGVNSYQAEIWRGVNAAARELDANLITYEGGELESSSAGYAFERQRNLIYTLVATDQVDGLIVLKTLGNNVSLEAFGSFFNRYPPLPVVGIACVLPGMPGVLVDNDTGMRDVLIHLIESHASRRIAFIRGPESNEEAEQRYRVYVDVLAQHALHYDPKLVVPGDFRPASGAEAVRLLLDERQLRPREDFDALVAANDDMAIGAMQALQERGVRMLADLPVVGFDDSMAARASLSPLTSVRQPFYAMGKQAVELLLALLAGEPASRQVMLPTELVVRQSCGCPAWGMAQAAVGQAGEVALAPQREKLLSAMAQAVASHRDKADPAAMSPALAAQWIERLLGGLTAEIEATSPGDGSSGASGIFLRELDGVLRQVMTVGGDVAAWQGAISALRRHLLPQLSSATATKAEGLCEQARVVIGKVAQRDQASQTMRAEWQAMVLREVSHSLMTTFDVERLMEVLADGLPRLGIPGAYLALYEDPAAPSGWARLRLAYSQAGRVELAASGRRFRAPQLVPEGMWPPGNGGDAFSLVAQPLFFREDQLGFVLFEVGPLDGNVYEVLRGEISSALQGALIVRQRQQALEEIARANAEIQKLNEQLEVENLRMAAELDVARRLQQMLLPAAEELRQIEGLDIAGFMQPADEVGGDYYDVLKHKDSVKIGIGDVTGHGLESGVVMLMLQTAVRLLHTLEINNPAHFLDALNRLLLANMRRMKVKKGVTLALLDCDAGRLAAPGRLRLSGQHEQLIVVRASGQVELQDTLDLGFPLGFEQDLTRFVGEAIIDLQCGDGVVLYSDGITEAENEAGDLYGLERLCKVVRTHWAKPAEAIKEAVVTDVRAFISRQKVYDDLTLLVVKQM
jgi:sigma-B regulation protein RsbU (phosphoserine phosphatase)